MKEILCRISTGPGEDLLPDHSEQSIQLLRGGVPAQGDPEGSVDGSRGNVHGCENVAAVTLCAGGTCADADTVILENVDGVLGGNSRNGNGKNVGRLMGAVDADALQSSQFFHKRFDEGLFLLYVLPEGGGCRAAGGGKAENGGSPLGAAAQAALLSAAQQQRREGFEPWRNIQRIPTVSGGA